MMKTGDKIRIVDDTDMDQYGLKEGDEGMANAVVSLPEGKFVFFMPEGRNKEQFVVNCDRFEVVGEYNGAELPGAVE